MTNILFNHLPKSGSLFIVRTIEQTFSCKRMEIATKGVNESQLDPRLLVQFMAEPKSISQECIPATKYNLDLMYYMGIRKFILQLRDPRDAMISWAYHLEREDARKQWHRALMFASKLMSENYYDLSWSEKLGDLIKMYYPKTIEWIKDWFQIRNDDRFMMHVGTYENFLEDKDNYFRKIADFFDLPDNFTLSFPQDTGRLDKQIHLDTHFRRGIKGSYLEELTIEQQKIINELSDPNLFKSFGWYLGNENLI